MEASKDEIQPIPRDPLRFEMVRLFEAHLGARGGTLHDPNAPGEFVASIGKPLTRAIRDPNLLRGLRAEALFEALVVSLGQVALIKQEDAGTAWAARRGLKIPDFRIVLPDGEMFLVEVKHFTQGGAATKPSVSAKYLDGLRAYGDVVGCPVKLAIYWARWNAWTLVPLSVWKRKDRPSLSLERATKANEMGNLGDLYVATQFPLRFRLVADPARDRKLGPDGQVAFTIGDVEMYCRDRRLTVKREQSIAMWFMLYGPWDEEATADVRDGELVGADFTKTPPHDSGQGFELVGALSGLFSSMFLSSTTEHDRVSRLGLAVTSGSLGSMIPRDYKSKSLPLWRFSVVPSQGRQVSRRK